MRAAVAWRASRRGIALGLVAGLVSVAVNACGSSSTPWPTRPVRSSTPSASAGQADSDFPANQVNAYDAFKAAISEYPAAPAASAGTKGAQSIADADWWANDHVLARLIPGARLVLYPDAGHGFLFQEGTPLASRVESFLTGHPSV